MLKSTVLGFISGLLLFIIFIFITMYFISQKVNKVVDKIEKEAKTVKFIKVLPNNSTIHLYSPITKKHETLNFDNKKPIFINFWATWCRPCVEEMKDIQELYQLKKEDVDFYVISTEKPDVISKFLKKKKWNMPIYTTTDSITFLKHQSIPRTYIIKNKVVYLSHIGKNNWSNKKVIEYLKGFEN